MNITPIRSAEDYRSSLREVSALMDLDPEPGTPEGDRLEVIATLVEAYEIRHFPMGLPDPVEALRFRMDQAGLTARDLEPFIGQSNRVYEVLNRKRDLTLPMIRRLHRGLNIPAEALIGETLGMAS